MKMVLTAFIGNASFCSIFQSLAAFFKTNLPYILAGISVGGQYALIAIGYTMVYGLLRLVNFAHGYVFMTAGQICFY